MDDDSGGQTRADLKKKDCVCGGGTTVHGIRCPLLLLCGNSVQTGVLWTLKLTSLYFSQLVWKPTDPRDPSVSIALGPELQAFAGCQASILVSKF